MIGVSQLTHRQPTKRQKDEASMGHHDRKSFGRTFAAVVAAFSLAGGFLPALPAYAQPAEPAAPAEKPAADAAPD